MVALRREGTSVVFLLSLCVCVNFNTWFFVEPA